MKNIAAIGLLPFLLGAALLAGCSDSGTGCRVDTDCPGVLVCVAGVCVNRDGGGGDGADTGDGGENAIDGDGADGDDGGAPDDAGDGNDEVDPDGTDDAGETPDDADATRCQDPVECDDQNPCTADSCDSGVCVYHDENEAQACSDGLYCTEPDACSQGACLGSPRECKDDDTCTADSCSEQEDRCVFAPIGPFPGTEGIALAGTCSNGLDDDCDGLVDAADPECVDDGMVEIPATTFGMGCAPGDDLCSSIEEPFHPVTLTTYRIDRTEVTQSAYELCHQADACNHPPCHYDPEHKPDFPVSCVNWSQADAYCRYVGKRLCTEAEWELAARGTDERLWPWGNERATCDYAVMNDGGVGCGSGLPWAVGSKPAGKSFYGLEDMAGNVTEWVHDWYDRDTYQDCASGCTDPQGPASGVYRLARGGGYSMTYVRLRVSERFDLVPSTVGLGVGFRCCKDVD